MFKDELVAEVSPRVLLWVHLQRSTSTGDYCKLGYISSAFTDILLLLLYVPSAAGGPYLLDRQTLPTAAHCASLRACTASLLHYSIVVPKHMIDVFEMKKIDENK